MNVGLLKGTRKEFGTQYQLDPALADGLDRSANPYTEEMLCAKVCSISDLLMEAYDALAAPPIADRRPERTISKSSKH